MFGVNRTPALQDDALGAMAFQTGVDLGEAASGLERRFSRSVF
jgi:hypothetical protein